MNGKQIKSTRKKLGLTQVELAKKLGVTASTVARWERDEMKPPGKLLELSIKCLLKNFHKI